MKVMGHVPCAPAVRAPGGRSHSQPRRHGTNANAETERSMMNAGAGVIDAAAPAMGATTQSL